MAKQQKLPHICQAVCDVNSTGVNLQLTRGFAFEKFSPIERLVGNFQFHAQNNKIERRAHHNERSLTPSDGTITKHTHLWPVLGRRHVVTTKQCKIFSDFSGSRRMAKVKSKFVKVLLKSIVTNHEVILVKFRALDNLEVLRYDPWLQAPSIYREVKKISSYKR